MARKSGISMRHLSLTIGQRVWKVHPGGGFAGLGKSPARIIRFDLSTVGSATGAALIKAFEYG